MADDVSDAYIFGKFGRAWGCTSTQSRTIMDILLVLSFVATVDMAVLHTCLMALLYFLVALALAIQCLGAQRKRCTLPRSCMLLSFTCGNAAALAAGERM